MYVRNHFKVYGWSIIYLTTIKGLSICSMPNIYICLVLKLPNSFYRVRLQIRILIFLNCKPPVYFVILPFTAVWSVSQNLLKIFSVFFLYLFYDKICLMFCFICSYVSFLSHLYYMSLSFNEFVYIWIYNHYFFFKFSVCYACCSA